MENENKQEKDIFTDGQLVQAFSDVAEEIITNLPIITGVTPDDLAKPIASEWIDPGDNKKPYWLAIYKGNKQEHHDKIVKVYESGVVKLAEGSGHTLAGASAYRISSDSSPEFAQKRRDKYIRAVQQALSGAEGVEDWEGGLAKVYGAIVQIATGRNSLGRAYSARDVIAATREIRQGLAVHDLRDAPGGGGGGDDAVIMEHLRVLEGVLGKALALKGENRS